MGTYSGGITYQVSHSKMLSKNGANGNIFVQKNHSFILRETNSKPLKLPHKIKTLNYSLTFIWGGKLLMLFFDLEVK